MHRLNEPQIDWTGVLPDQSPIAPLDEATFMQRLRLLSDRAEAVTTLRKAFQEQHPDQETNFRMTSEMDQLAADKPFL
jgi:hypothetical protein